MSEIKGSVATLVTGKPVVDAAIEEQYVVRVLARSSGNGSP